MVEGIPEFILKQLGVYKPKAKGGPIDPNIRIVPGSGIPKTGNPRIDSITDKIDAHRNSLANSAERQIRFRTEIERFKKEQEEKMAALKAEFRQKLGSPELREVHNQLGKIKEEMDIITAFENKDYKKISGFYGRIIKLLEDNWELILNDGSDAAKGLEGLLPKIKESKKCADQLISEEI